MKEFAGPSGVMFTDCIFNNQIILKSQQRFKSDCYNVYTWQINKMIRDYNIFIWNKRIQSMQKWVLKVKHKMINFDDYTKENK